MCSTIGTLEICEGNTRLLWEIFMSMIFLACLFNQGKAVEQCNFNRRVIIEEVSFNCASLISSAEAADVNTA